MPKRTENKTPQPRKHLNMLVTYVDGGRKRISFGRWGDPAALKKFYEFWENRLAGNEKNTTPEFSSGGAFSKTSALNTMQPIPQNGKYPSVADLVAAFLPYAKEHKKSNWYDYRTACTALLNNRYAHLTTADFDAYLLFEIQNEFVQRDLELNYCNTLVRNVIAVFRWGEARRLVPPGKSEHLRTIEPVKPGMARENDPREDVPREVVERTLALTTLRPVYKAFIRILMETGARPKEILRLKVGDIEKKPAENAPKIAKNGAKITEIWVFKPKNHKTARKNKRRIITFGAKEQSILAPYMANKPPESAIFSPKDAIFEYYQERRAKRKTPLTSTEQKKDKHRKRTRQDPKVRGVGDVLSTNTVGEALRVAIERANRELPPNQQIPEWTLYQLRHLYLTDMTERFGEEIAALMAGHSSPEKVRRIYDHSQERRIIRSKLQADSENENAENES